MIIKDKNNFLKKNHRQKENKIFFYYKLKIQFKVQNYLNFLNRKFIIK